MKRGLIYMTELIFLLGGLIGVVWTICIFGLFLDKG